MRPQPQRFTPPRGIAQAAIANSFCNFLFLVSRCVGSLTMGTLLCGLPHSQLRHSRPKEPVARIAASLRRTVAFRELRVTRRAATRASRAFLPISLIQRADNDGPTCFPIRRLAAELIDAQGAVDWRAAFGAPSHRFLSSAHARTLLRRFVTG